jgi:pimeloyl-ACP methyl ester carboxylesterase
VEKVRLVLHGWGAGGGLVFAQAHARRVSRLVLCNALPLLEGFRWDRTARILRTPLVGELVMGATSRRMLARALRRGGRLSERELRTIWDHFDQGTQRAILRLHRATPEPRLADAGGTLGALTMPVLVVWGEGDPWFAPELADAYAARLPRARLERVADAGHWPWLEEPAALERIVEFVEAA